MMGLIPYLIVAMIVRQTIKLDVGLCAKHRARRRNTILIAWLFCLAGPVLFFMLISNNPPNPFGALFILLLPIGLIIGIAGSQTIIPKQIDEVFARMAKVHPDYLAALPDWSG